MCERRKPCCVARININVVLFGSIRSMFPFLLIILHFVLFLSLFMLVENKKYSIFG